MVAPLAIAGLSTAADIVGNVLDSANATSAAAAGRKAKTKQTAQDFEKVFLEQSFDRIAQGGGEDGPLGASGTGGDVYRSMLVKEYAGEVVKSGGVGIADAVYKQMLQIQEGANGG